MTDARNNRLHFQRRQVLRLVHHHKLIRDAAPANIRQRLHGDQAGRLQRVAVPLRMVPPSVRQQIQRIVNRLHPGIELLLHRAGQIPDVLPHRERRAANQHLPIHFVPQGLVQSGRNRQQRLARACLADDRDNLDPIIEQRINRKVLLLVARLNRPHLLGRANQRHHGVLLPVVPAHRGVR